MARYQEQKPQEPTYKEPAMQRWITPAFLSLYTIILLFNSGGGVGGIFIVSLLATYGCGWGSIVNNMQNKMQDINARRRVGNFLGACVTCAVLSIVILIVGNIMAENEALDHVIKNVR